MSVRGPERQRSGLAASFGNPSLRKLYLAETVSGVGDGVLYVALMVFLADQPRFGLWITLAVVARLAPRALLSLPAGSLVDRSNKRRLIVTSELLRAALMVVLAALAALDAGAVPVLVVVALSYALGAPTRPALSAVVPTLAGERHLAVANAALSTIRQVMTFIGPLVGVVVAIWSPSVGFAVNAAAFAISGLLLAAVSNMPGRNEDSKSTTLQQRRGLGVVSSFVDGFAAVRLQRELPPLVALIGVMYFVRGTEMVMLVYVVRDLLDADVSDVGLLSGAIGLGAVLAMPIAARAANSRSPVRPLVASLVVTAIPTAALAFLTDLLWASVVVIGIGVGMVVFEVVIVVMVQRVGPDATLGRVFGAINAASNSGKLLGALAAPALIAVAGLETALMIVGAVVLVAAALAVKPLVVIGRLAAARQRDLAPRVRTLGALAIFDGASEASLERLAAELVPVEVAAGEVVVREGDAADNLYVAIAGSLSVSVSGREVGSLGPNDWFGEIGLFDRRPRTATVTAVGDTTLWRIDGTMFLAVLENAGAAPSALLEGIADRLATHQ